MRAAGVAVLVLGGCSFSLTGGALPADADAVLVDAAFDSASDAPVVLGPWGTPALMSIPGTAGGDDDPSLTADRLELYFNRSSDIYVTTRTTVGSTWSQPQRVNELSTGANETTPEVTSDGLTIFFASARGGGQGSDDIWMSTRISRSSPWTAPTVVSTVSSPDSEAAPAVTDDLLAMVITTTRTGTNGAEIFASTRATASAGWSTPVALTTINSTGNDYSPILAQNKRTLYLDANPGGGSSDLYMAVRATATESFGAPTVIAELSGNANDSDPWVSPDGRHLVFVSDRSGTFAMYEATR